jgi:23S rRNA (uracil1939-C5)-methyltransferase
MQPSTNPHASRSEPPEKLLLSLDPIAYGTGMGPAVGDHLTLTVSDIAFGAEGVARANDFVFFVPWVAVGEVIEVEVTEVKKHFGRAKLLRVIVPSPDRVQPLCRYFGECGGCQYQHIDYSAQLRLKHKQVRDLFERIGGLDSSAVTEVVPCPKPYGYRNRIMIRSQWNKFKQGLNIGFIRAADRLVEDIERCEISEPVLNEEIRKVRANPPAKGGLKVVLRVAPEGWEVPRDSFFQNNFWLLPGLVNVARNFIKNSGARNLADIYCGVGFFSIELADLVDSFIGVEYDRLAIEAARRNAAARGRANGEFLAGKAEEALPGILARFQAKTTCVLVDPPRKGCWPEMLDLLRRVRPLQVIYISCHPATMARDLNVLCADAVFKVAQVVPLDMFPQTAHVECVADLRSSTVADSGAQM